MLRPESTRKNLVQHVLGIVQIHFDFFEYDLPLFLQVLGIELRPQHQVRDDAERDRQMLVEHFGVEANLLFGGEGVEHAPDRVHFPRNRFRRAALGAFEDHMLHEVRQAVFGGDFPA